MDHGQQCEVARMMKRNPHATVVLQALLVTFIWSTSVILIKVGLQDIPALTFGGLRYFLAFLVLLPVFVLTGGARMLKQLSARDWTALVALGIAYYSLTQGTQFMALAYLPAVNLSLILNGTAVVVALLSIFLLNEIPSRWQVAGMLLFFAGVVVFFYPFMLPSGQLVGYIIAIVHLLANAFSSILGRAVNRHGRFEPLSVTTISMGAGGTLLLALGVAIEPAPQMDARAWIIVGVLAVANTAFAFTLWNRTLRSLTATESTMINNTMLIQVALLAWIFLGESITLLQLAGMVIAGAGVLMVQLRNAGTASVEADEAVASN